MARKDPGPLPQARHVTAVGVKRGKHPGFIKPQLATLHGAPPAQDTYLHEVKFDGYRLQAHMRGGLGRAAA